MIQMPYQKVGLSERGVKKLKWRSAHADDDKGLNLAQGHLPPFCRMFRTTDD
jgi:hypothetical protein